MRNVALTVPDRNVEVLLRQLEEPVPPAGLAVVLALGDVVRRRLPLRHQRLRRVEHAEREVEQAARDRRIVDAEVRLVEVKAADADHQQRHVVRVELVGLHDLAVTVALLERERALGRADDVLDALHHVPPRGLHRVLEVEHRGVGAVAVVGAGEHVDDHLRVRHRAGDLDAAREEVVGERADLPVAVGVGVLVGGEIVGKGAGVPRRLPVAAGVEEGLPFGFERAVERGDERKRFRREHALRLRGVRGLVDGDPVGEGLPADSGGHRSIHGKRGCAEKTLRVYNLRNVMSSEISLTVYLTHRPATLFACTQPTPVALRAV